MNKPVIFGALLLGVAGYAAASCSSKKDDNGTTATGGQSSTSGGQSSNAGASTGGGPSGGASTAGADSGVPFACGHADASVETNAEGGLVQIGYTDPARSVVLGDGGHYVMPNTKYKGYCFTYVDAGGSSVYPPCGTTGPCFTASTGLCPSASLGPGSANDLGRRHRL